jgi:hypothetical protein
MSVAIFSAFGISYEIEGSSGYVGPFSWGA